METDDTSLVAVAGAVEPVVSEEGTEILIDAIRCGREEDVRMILRAVHIDPNNISLSTGKYPLHVAVASGNLLQVKELLRARAEPDARDREFKTALHVAAREDLAEAVKLLLHEGANPNAEDARGHTPLWHAASSGKSPRALAILTEPNERGIDIINHVGRDQRNTRQPSGLPPRPVASLPSDRCSKPEQSQTSRMARETRYSTNQTWPLAIKMALLTPREKGRVSGSKTI